MKQIDKTGLRALTIWSWLFPLTYLIHIAEEFWGGEGYPAYLLRLRGVHLSTERFLVGQSIGLILVTMGVVIARRWVFQRFMLTILSALVMTNGITHTTTAIYFGGYGPGLLSSMLIWIPLGAISLVRLNREMTNRRFYIAAAVGVTIAGLVALVALHGGKVA